MLEIKPFNRNILKEVSYYEVLDYVADYIQDFLKQVFGSNIELPIDIDSILKKLEIKIEQENNDTLSPKILGSLHYTFRNGNIEETSIAMEERPFSEYYLASWVKLKCLAQYILYSSLPKEKIIIPFSEDIIRLPQQKGAGFLTHQIAYELLLPWRQAISYLEKSKFLETLNNSYLWKKYGESAIGQSIPFPYPATQKTMAYHHLIECLEAKEVLDKIGIADIKQYEAFKWALIIFLEDPFTNDSDDFSWGGLTPDPADNLQTPTRETQSVLSKMPTHKTEE